MVINKILRVFKSSYSKPKINHIKVYYNGKKHSDSTLTNDVRLIFMISELLIENNLYVLQYLYKEYHRYYLSNLYDIYIIKEENSVYLFQPIKSISKSKDKIYLEMQEDFILKTGPLSQKINIMDSDKTFYILLLVSQEFEKRIFIVTNPKLVVNLQEEVKFKIGEQYDFEIIDLEYDKTCYLRKNFDFHSVLHINKIYIKLNVNKRNLLDRFISYLK